MTYYSTCYTFPEPSGAITTTGTVVGGGLCVPGTTFGGQTCPVVGGNTAGTLESSTGNGTNPGLISHVITGTSGTLLELQYTITGLFGSAGSVFNVTLNGTSIGITNIVALSTNGSGTITIYVLPDTYNVGIEDLRAQYFGQVYTLPGFLGNASLNSATHVSTAGSSFTFTNTITTLTGPALTLGSPTTTSLTATWTVPPGPTPDSYTLQYSPHGLNTWTPITGISGLTETVTGLSANTNYDFQITAIITSPIAPLAVTGIAGSSSIESASTSMASSTKAQIIFMS